MLLYSVSGKRKIHIVHFHKLNKSYTWWSGPFEHHQGIWGEQRKLSAYC